MRACFSTLTRLITPCVSHLSHLRGMRVLDFFFSTFGVGGALSSVVWVVVGSRVAAAWCRTFGSVGKAVEEQAIFVVLLANL